jgi:hypothetical protein
MVAPLFDRSLFLRLLEFMQSLLSGRVTLKEPYSAVVVLYSILVRFLKNEFCIIKQNPPVIIGIGDVQIMCTAVICKIEICPCCRTENNIGNVIARLIKSHYDESEGDYYLASPVNNSTMLWNVGGLTGWKYFRLNKVDSFIYIKRLDKTSNNITDVVFGSATGADLNFAYNSGAHNLYISDSDDNWRILFDNTKFIFEKSNQDTIQNDDGGIWLFECNPTTEERLHEFK